MENVIIRKIRPNELDRLEEFMYESIYQPDKTNLIPREVLQFPRIRIYFDGFGEQQGDHCFVAEVNDEVVGMVWTRILSVDIKGYGNIDSETPEFAISLYEQYRNRGIGTQLMATMIEHLRNIGYKQASLSVQKENYAVKMYKDLSFETVNENSDDYIMLCKLT